MDLAAEGKRVKKNASKQGSTGGEERYFAEFVPDIDNFVGVKNINNFAIMSIKDDGYQFGDRSVGILQLYNKTDGKNITKEDVARLKWVAQFLGALSLKCHCITSSWTLIVGLAPKTGIAKDLIEGLDLPASGGFQALQTPLEVSLTQLELESGGGAGSNANPNSVPRH